MKQLKVLDIRKLDEAGIQAKVEECRKQIFDLRMKRGTSGLEKPHQFKILKGNLARLLTIDNEMKLTRENE